ncbi:transmembrane protein [Citrus sinensis]|uniref:Transmembrane protein n=2 Tax=Citrus sinensis TaxID=2711 RepID=A0ACB8N9L4_CITSI|nr:transmembrane protein [Citrus sinensis]
MKMAFLTGKASFFVLVLVLVSLRSISALSQDGSDRDALKLILGEHNLGPLKNGINEDAVAPGPEMLEPLLLASNRTKRPDILNHFRRYQGGWDITNKHYWASVGFTGAAAFILAVIWIGCILLSVGQDEFHGEAMHTLKYVVNQSDYTVKTLRNVTEYLSLAKTINVAQVFLPSAVMDDIDKLNRDLSTAANTLADKTSENSAKIRKVFNAVRSALITVAALMLLLSIIGLFLSILRHKHAIHIFILSGWLLVAITFILCGVFVILNNAISDTCMAMDEWVDHPHAETALSNILPCVDQRTTNKSLIQSKEVITDIVNVVNQFVYNIANANPSQDYIYYYNQTGPVMPPLCYPYDSQLQDRQCGSYEVSIANASEVWQNYSCELSTSGSSAFGQCNSVGRVTPYFYKELVSAVTEIYALQLYTPRLLSLQDCNFVRDTFQNITSNYCPPLEHYLKIVNAGLGMISVGVLLCLLLWILYANRPQREEVFVNLPLPIKCISRSQKNSVNSSNGNHVATPNTLNEV